MNTLQVYNYFKNKKDVPSPYTDCLVQAGYQQESGGYIDYAKEQGIEIDYKKVFHLNTGISLNVIVKEQKIIRFLEKTFCVVS